MKQSSLHTIQKREPQLVQSGMDGAGEWTSEGGAEQIVK